jgi:hypothetical protein
MTNEHESLCVAHPFGGTPDQFLLSSCLRLAGLLLKLIAPIMLSLGCLDMELSEFGSGVELCKNGFMLVGTEHLGKLYSSRRYQEKHAPQHYRKRSEQLNHAVQVSEVIAGQGRIELNRQPGFVTPSDGVEGLPIGPCKASKSVVLEEDGEQ